jgi:outer membrane lipoprotein-sorting protein
MRLITKALCLLVFLLAAGFALAQSDFSAEVFDTQKSDSASQAKMYVSKDKIRIEPTGKNARGGAIVMNLTAQSAIVVMDQQHMYMDLPVQMANTRVAYTFFRAGDVEDACASWANSAKNKGGSCHKVGSDTVNGRSAIKYEGTNANGESSTFWIDPKIEFPVKWQTKNSSGELRNIQEGSQSASLFDVPAGYTKFDMGAMMQQHQQ